MPWFLVLFSALLYAAFGASHAFSAMPRCWSAAALARRRQRAIDRGFITPHSGPNRKFIETHRHLASNVRLMARSVELHARHDLLSGSQHHYARLATAAAKELLPKAEQVRAQRTHRLANAAKHALPWADAWSDDDFPALDSRPSLPPGGAPLPSPSPRSGGASSSRLCSTTCCQTVPPDSADAAVQTDAHADACGAVVLWPELDARLKDSERTLMRAAAAIVEGSLRDFANEFSKKCAEMHDAALARAAELMDERMRALELLDGRVRDACAECTELAVRLAALERSVAELAAPRAWAAPPRPAPMTVDPEFAVGCAVRFFGLTKASHLNDRLAHVEGLDVASGRLIVRLDPQADPVKIRPDNCQFPAQCPRCGSECPSASCFSCGPESSAASAASPCGPGRALYRDMLDYFRYAHVVGRLAGPLS